MDFSEGKRGSRPTPSYRAPARDQRDRWRDAYRPGYGAREEDQRPAERRTIGAIVAGPGRWALRVIEQAIPNPRTVDGMAYELARRTPRAIAVSMILLIAGIVASRLNLWVEGFLWAIPSLGALSLGLGFGIWSSNVYLRRDLSPEARAALRRAMRLQIILIVAGVLCAGYFVGMLLRWW